MGNYSRKDEGYTLDAHGNFADLKNIYDNNFYKHQIDGSYRSAKKYVSILWPMYKPKSVVDVGCGRGAWLKAFKDNGAETLVGIDGTWNSKENMIDDSILFYAADLNRPRPHPEDQKFDLAISLEVAEHLEKTSAQDFIRSLTELSDAILFSAAFSKQGGDNHINEQLHSYWAEIFASFGFRPLDLFRPIVWGDKDVEYWYQQNCFLYVKTNSPISDHFTALGKHPIVNKFFLDCIHPDLYKRYSDRSYKYIVKQAIKEVVPRRLLTIAKRIVKH